MCIFETITFDLDDIPFKDSKKYFDELLLSLGIEYTDVSFIFCDTTPRNQSLICNKFPWLMQYLQCHKNRSDLFTTVPSDWTPESNIHMQKSDAHFIDDFLSKIPRPYNFSVSTVMLDNVNWNARQKQTNPCYRYSDGKPLRPHLYFCDYFSNCIRFSKGAVINKKNRVEIVCERDFNNEVILPRPEKLEQLLKSINKKFNCEIACLFEPSEYEKTDKSKKKILDMLNDESEADFAEFKESVFEFIQQYIADFDKNYSPLKGFSPQKILSKVAKEYGFKYHGFKNGGDYHFIKQLQAGHSLTVEFGITPFEPLALVVFQFDGYNYNISKCLNSRLYIPKAQNLENLAQIVFEYLLKIENKYSYILLNEFGMSPTWWQQ